MGLFGTKGKYEFKNPPGVNRAEAGAVDIDCEDKSNLTTFIKSSGIKKELFSPVWKQVWSITGVLLTNVSLGMVLSFVSCLLPSLQAPDSPIKVDTSTLSWLASCFSISAVFGFIISALLMDRIGRKYTFIAILIPSVLGWLLIYFGTTITMLILGRVFNGITSGAAINLGAVVIGEYSDPKYRGTFLNLKTAAYVLGSTTIHVLDNYFHWRTVALISLIPLILILIIVFTWVESPPYLAMKKEFKKCEEAFWWMREKNENNIRELEELIRVHRETSVETQKPTARRDIINFFKKFTRKDFLKPLFIFLLVCALLESSGRHIFPAFALRIIKEMTGTETNTFLYTLLIDLIMLVSSCFSSILVKVFKRRTVLFASGISSMFVLILLSLYLLLVSKNYISNDHTWVPVVMLMIYFVLVGLGCTPIPLALLGELFPLPHRGVGTALSGIFMCIFLTVALWMIPPMLAVLKIHGTFSTLALISGIALSILYFVLPETKDRTLQEIENYFNFGKFNLDEGKDGETKLKHLNTGTQS